MSNNYYCSQKWWWLTVDPERRLLASCCKSAQHSIDTDWLKSNPGKLFNIPILVQERADMLENNPVASCSKACWVPESKGIPSRRTMLLDESTREFTGTTGVPEVVEIILGSDCNMSCVYCSKRFSSAWLRDIRDNGSYISNYTVDDRFDITIDDKVIMKLSQSELSSSSRYQTILNDLTKLGKLKTLKIMGGEPFLYNSLQDLLRFVEADAIDITTGLGVNPKRFERLLQSVPRDKTTLVLSAESTGKNYEFVRNGNTYENFLTNFEIIKKYKIKYRFGITLSNLNIHDFKRFQDEFATDDDYFNVLVDPVFLSPGLVDPETKERILSTTFKHNEKEIHQAVAANYSEIQLQHFRQYVTEYTRRRNLSLDIFPESFKTWILE